ncbi:hypothetical protein [Stenotrophomonas sp. G106K1]|uniref:hypothetical protein n=1 Tax=Stenotrophomonas sp. G106K1 TaxID=3134792 RepID=UPI0030F406D7
MPDVKLSQLAAASAASVAAGAGLWTMAGHILGLRMEYVGPASVRVSSGSAWIPSLQQAIEVPSALTLSGLTLAGNTWYHLYLFLNGSTPSIEAVTDAPAAPYSGSARAKTGANTRRYIGSFRTDATGAIRPFVHAVASGEVLFCSLNDFVVGNGLASVSTAVDCSPYVPVTGVAAKCLMGNDNASASVLYGHPIVGTLTSTNYIGPIPPKNNLSPDVPLSTSQQFLYKFDTSVTGSGLYVRVYGYRYER